MEPTSPAPHGSPEMGPPQQPLGPEALPHHSPETQASPERPAPEERRVGHDGDGVAMPVPTTPLPVAPVADPASPVVDSGLGDDNPLAAADEDLIEKEWVDRAKKIIAETKHDPYEQERAISRLQADYQKKRYGREVKLKSGD